MFTLHLLKNVHYLIRRKRQMKCADLVPVAVKVVISFPSLKPSRYQSPVLAGICVYVFTVVHSICMLAQCVCHFCIVARTELCVSTGQAESKGTEKENYYCCDSLWTHQGTLLFRRAGNVVIVMASSWGHLASNSPVTIQTFGWETRGRTEHDATMRRWHKLSEEKLRPVSH